PPHDRTEVGRLGLALNAMLGRLEQAFAQRHASEQRLRRFVADASHELRTPLASIRGYSELFRMGASSDPEETATAMRRIEQEAARMGVLVEDLLTLARLDEVRDPVREPVDLAVLANDAADDARAMAPDREITVTGQREVPAVGDPHQLRQVLANLVRNALVHTPPDAAIEIGARADASGRAVLRVRDHGQGLPSGTDPADLFERFWRAEGGRARGRGGAGLGLAIVAGIVEQHGGTVRAANAEGGGAEFVVELPMASPFKNSRSGVENPARAAAVPGSGDPA
ncbi:MAG: sensor histidine kinase, partial [Baekduiaceae bacterium]